MPFWAYAALPASWSNAAMEAGLSDSAAFFFESSGRGGRVPARLMRSPGDAVLFKGSRGVQVEKALERAFGEAKALTDALLASLRAALSR